MVFHGLSVRIPKVDTDSVPGGWPGRYTTKCMEAAVRQHAATLESDRTALWFLEKGKLNYLVSVCLIL